jgi:spermidine/putrescine transport system permease protein
VRKLGHLLKRFYMGLVLFFLYAPILVMIVLSFNEGKSRGNFTGFSLKWYVELFTNREIMEALSNTLIVGVLSALIATAVGTFAAFGISQMRKRSQGLVMNISYLPVINPDIVTGVSLMMLFVFMKMNLGFATMLISHVMFNIPYVILSVMPRIQQMDKHLFEAAMDLGMTPLQAFFRVVLPDIMPGIVSGCILAFTLSIDDFVVSFFTSSGVQNLSIYIYSSARRGIEPTVYAIMALMFVTVLTLLLFINRKTLLQSRRARQPRAE